MLLVMAITVYSQQFEREIDVEQLLSLKGYFDTSKLVTLIKNLSKTEKDDIYHDVLCPICRCKGGILVAPTLSKQAYFKFDSHKYFCDYNNSKKSKGQKGKKVNFGDSRSEQTKLIRALVVRGIEQKIFTQLDIEGMRRYFYDTKVESQYTMDVPKKALSWTRSLRSLHNRSLPYVGHMKFNPAHAQLPSFNWRLAAITFFVKENFDLIKLAKGGDWIPTNKLYNKVETLIDSTQNTLVFDVNQLYLPYQNTITFSEFIKCHFKDMKNIKKADLNMLFAFSALLLYVSDWDIESAIEKVIKIVKAPKPVDENSGNVIGFNPFYDFEAWMVISKIKEVVSASKNGLDYKSQIDSIEEQLKDEYKLWESRKLNPNT